MIRWTLPGADLLPLVYVLAGVFVAFTAFVLPWMIYFKARRAARKSP